MTKTALVLRTLGESESLIQLGEELLDAIDVLLGQTTHRVFIVSDPVVMGLYGSRLVSAFTCANIEPVVIQIPCGERHKTLSTVERVYLPLLDHQAERSDTLLGFGGGIVGDTAGFVASTFKRGMRLVQVPSTLLGQVDSSVGGKTGVNLRGAKNMIGTFYQPSVVLNDITLLETLPHDELLNGIAEAIKYAFTMDEGLFTWLKDNRTDIIQRKRSAMLTLVERCIRNKVRIVQADVHEERGIREILNFGHTVGHAIEYASSHALTHGEAVAIGMVEETKLSVEMGLTCTEDHDKLVEILRAFGLPTTLPKFVGSKDVNDAIRSDKKLRNGRLKAPIIIEVGKADVRELDPDCFFMTQEGRVC